MKRIYLDHAGATPVRSEVLQAMLPFFTERFGNPSAVYDLGSEVKDILEEQRAKVAALIGAEAKEIVFASSGAEANNLAIKGAALAHLKKGRHLIVSGIEHHSVLNAARYLEKFHDFEVTFLPVDKYGLVNPERLKKALTPATVLVSIQHGSNEIGTIQPIPQLAAICREAGVLFHTDAIATAGNIPIDIKELQVDLLSLNGPGLAGPKGIGAMFFRRTVRLVPEIHGGIQENGRHGGTENVPGIVGLGMAAELARKELEPRALHFARLRDRLVAGIQERIASVVYTGHPERRLPGHASFCIEGLEGEALLFMLNHRGIYANTGSACASKALKVSAVLCAIGIPPDLAQGSVVFTFGAENREDEVDYVLAELPEAVEKLIVFAGLAEKAGSGGGIIMKLSTKSRYGTRLLVDMAQHANNGPLHLSDIAQRQGISVKYLEQIIIPLRKAGYIQGVRGPQGGHALAKPLGEIRVGDVVALLEEGDVLVDCSADASVCERADTCITRFLWKEAAQAMFEKLNSYTLADLAAMSEPENEIRE